MVKILDCTTRDGGHETNWVFEEEAVMSLIEELKISNMDYYEIGYRNHFEVEGKGSFYKCTPEFLEKFYKIKGNLQLGIMTDTKRFSIEDFDCADKDFTDFVRIACHPDKINETLKFAEVLKEKGYKIFVQLMDISKVDIEGYLALYEWKNKEILESLYFADTYGQLYPKDIEKYYNKLKLLGFKNISFHAHNNNGQALENVLTAIKLGAYSVDVSQNGLGGNLDAKELIKQ